MATNLYEYYTGQGQALPSVQQRTATATQAGISNYTGTAEQNNQLLSYLQQPKTLNSSNLQSNPAIQLPPTPVDNTNYGGMIAGGNSVIGANATYLTPSGAQVTASGQTVQPPTSALDTFKSYIGSLVKPPSASDSYNTLYGQSGIDQKQADFNAKQQEVLNAQGEFNGINAQLQGLQAEYNAVPTAIQQESVGRGRTEAGVAPLTADQQRSIALRSIPLQTQALVSQARVAQAQGNLALSQSILNQATDHLDKVFQIRMQDAQTQYQFQNNQIDRIYNFLSDQEKQRADELRVQKAQEYQTQRDTIDYQRQVEMAKLQNSLKPQPTTPTPTNILAGLTPEQQKDPFLQKLVASAGGKALTDTSIQSLNKGINVLGQLGVLQTNIANISTGPIIGAFKGANPWDTNAQTIKAQLNAIVPNLARGIYGEVGVLTDNDIRTYAKTLPNLTSTESVRNAILGITLDQISKSIKTTLEVNAAAGRDVSGFVDLYTNMLSSRDSILSQIPGYKGTSAPSLTSLGITPDEQNLFQSVVGSGSSTAQTTSGGFFSNIWKALTGN